MLQYTKVMRPNSMGLSLLVELTTPILNQWAINGLTDALATSKTEPQEAIVDQLHKLLIPYITITTMEMSMLPIEKHASIVNKMPSIVSTNTTTRP